jgi:hypothetical protein
MLFQLLKDDSEAFRAENDVVFHSPRDFQLLAFSFILTGFGTLCFFDAEPRQAGAFVALGCSVFAAISAFFGGLSTTVVFHRRLLQMDVNWMLFGTRMISHSHPYSEVTITLRTIARLYASRWAWNPGGRGTGYYAKVGVPGYFLVYPASVPISEDHLENIRKELGFAEDCDVGIVRVHSEKNENAKAGP